ncbi:protein SMAX1-LIKE 4-like [Salvia splendens]|uniref:protein SMAX1-LIKE 4-like n=1 Tax=Salvia splendens TaxID=180675 RepID=UPI0011007A6E|nr:protein SMAX1-LIKE 4-like [Salvia splendens]
MRAGGCAAQQTLSAEAGAVLKHSLGLARRRGHAQVTPLHVAATLLSSRSSLLRRACLRFQPPQHPLHCRALELCFNVALNRLPASPLHHHHPSLSNALVAALKRAQAHQRRGSIEQHDNHNSIPHHQTPLISIKVELEQLVLSILDDPSVSRVMREAGFSSTQIKSNLDEITSSSSSSSVFHCFYSTPNSPPSPPPLTPPQDISYLFHIMSSRRCNAVIITDNPPTAESLISNLISLVDRGDVPEQIKSARVVKFEFSSVPLALMNKEEVDMNVADLKRKVDSYAASGKVIVYVGDLKWAADPGPAVSHLVSEIGKLVAWYSASSLVKVWLMATASYQTYVKCQMKQPPLDALWGLQPLSVPSGGLGLTLTSGGDSRIAFSENSSPVSGRKAMVLKEEGGDDVLTCCQECRLEYEKEASLVSIHQRSFLDKEHLPSWLKPHADKDDLDQLRRKYNRQCQNLHQSHLVGRNSHHYLNKSTLFGDSETISFAYPAVRAGASTLPRFRRQQSCHIEFSFSNGSSKHGAGEPNLDSLKRMEDAEVKITLALGSSCIDEAKHERALLRDLLRENLPWQMEAIPLIVEALMSSDDSKFVVFHGNDSVGKRRVALAAAEAVFGSSERLLIVKTRSHEDHITLERGLRDHDGKVVVLVEDAEFADPDLIKFLGDGLETNRDSIFIFATDGDTNGSCTGASPVIRMRLECTLPHQKRKAEWESGGGRGKRRRVETDEVSSNGLDLNVRADEDVGDLSPISSDLTREITMEPPHTSLALLKRIKKRVELNRGSEQDREARGALLAEFERAFNEAGGGSGLEVEEEVLEHVLRGMGLYLNSLFGKWLKDIFQTSLDGIGEREREKVSVRLCLVGEGEKEEGDGFKGTSLPKRILVSYIG